MIAPGSPSRSGEPVVATAAAFGSMPEQAAPRPWEAPGAARPDPGRSMRLPVQARAGGLLAADGSADPVQEPARPPITSPALSSADARRAHIAELAAAFDAQQDRVADLFAEHEVDHLARLEMASANRLLANGQASPAQGAQVPAPRPAAAAP